MNCPGCGKSHQESDDEFANDGMATFHFLGFLAEFSIDEDFKRMVKTFMEYLKLYIETESLR